MTLSFEGGRHLHVLFRKTACKERARSTKRRATYGLLPESNHLSRCFLCTGPPWWPVTAQPRNQSPCRVTVLFFEILIYFKLLCACWNPHLFQVALCLLHTNVFSFLGCPMLLDDIYIDPSVNSWRSCWRT